MAELKGATSKIEAKLDQAIERSREHLLEIQYPEGYWWGELESNVTIIAEYLLLTHFLGIPDPDRWRKICNYLRSRQLPDGSWSIYYGGPGDLSTTIESYFALKLAGISPDEPFMQTAREFIRSQGGVPKARVFTKIWLALFGQWNWDGTPMMPPEIIFLPSWFPFNIYEFSCWARQTIVPMTIILTKRPVCPIPEHAHIDELYPEPRGRIDTSLPSPDRWISWKGFFMVLDRWLRVYEKFPWKPGRTQAIRRAVRWIIERQEADGSWGGIQPPWVYSLIALKTLGYPIDHPVIAQAIEGFETFAIEEGETWRVQSCISPVWDAVLAMIALLDAGLPSDHPALVKAGRWLFNEQIFTGGDWQVKNRRGRPGGWAFEFENDIYPDIDDTAEVMIALHRTWLPESEKAKALERGLEWLLSMQSRNGGWAAFDVDNTRRFMAKIPFADFGELIDPPSVDVTAHVVELLGMLGYDRNFPPIRRALTYLRNEQEPDGSWFGRWGVNYIYGTGAVLPALQAIGEEMDQAYVTRAVRWLMDHQNSDGGWGETCASYTDPNLHGQGESTASQTAWALLGLLAAGTAESPAVERGILYLIETQEADGSWDEPQFTGTGFPGAFMINYHLYRDYFPLMALGRYRRILSRKGKED
ncbi:MAG: squalene--hopene cyclase [Candidatus Bipolaricaulia bacterium]